MKLKVGHSAMFVVSLKDRVIWLQGDIVEGVGKCMEKGLEILNRASADLIRIYLSSRGGVVLEEVRIIRAVDASPAPVAWIAFNRVASAALVILQSGKRRYALPHTKLVFHQSRGILASGQNRRLLFNAADCLREFEDLKRADALALCQLTRHALFEAVEPLFAREAIVSVAHAMRLGMIDGYYDTKEFQRDQRVIARLYRKSRG